MSSPRTWRLLAVFCEKQQETGRINGGVNELLRWPIEHAEVCLKVPHLVTFDDLMLSIQFKLGLNKKPSLAFYVDSCRTKVHNLQETNARQP